VIRTGLGRPRNIALALSVTVAVVACSSGSDADPDPTAATTSSTVTTVADSDRQLTIGAMLPPAATLLREPFLNGVETAIDEINANGGVFGRRVRFERTDEGDNAAAGATAVQNLIDRDVDAIIGPASSTIAASALTGIVSHGVVACSPTASALSLDDFPDPGLFFRTVPSDSLQAKAISQMAEGTGFPSVVVAYVDDGYGRPLSVAVTDELAAVQIDVADSVAFASTEADQIGVNHAESVQRVIDSEARVLILLAGSNDGTQFLEALSDESVPSITTIIVNDALRSPESVQRLAALRKSTRDKILGVAPQSESSDPASPFSPPGPFATQAYDCVTLIALAASLADSDIGADIAGFIPLVSTGGRECHTFLDCSREARETRQIEYDGPSGLTEIGSSGDPIRARFDRFTFDDEGNDTLGTPFLVPA
jgi:branched-chain amino acid transport system substrate-binding protein